MTAVDWDHVDWAALERLRKVFLADASGPGAYWKDPTDLASYDFTFGRRIAWKWAAVLEPLLAGGWTPPARLLVDWACGSAVASRSLLAYAGAASFDRVLLWDHSPAATAFATEAIRTRHPQVRVDVGDPAEAPDGGFVLVVSHVLNELDPPARGILLELARRAAAVLWLEPGTHADSRRLIAVREELRPVFHCLAPCPHDGACGLLTAGNERHWCHHFASPPTEVFTERGWAEFSRRLGIDRRSLPYSHLVLDRREPHRTTGQARVLGEPRRSAGLMRILRCRADGVREVELQRRTAPALWRTLTQGRPDGLFSWTEKDRRIAGDDPGS